VARERLDITEVCRQYKARVIRVSPVDDFFLLETNRGPKELRVWPRVDVMRWSFAWREQMARQGVREVERFIRTRDAKPYLVAGKRGFTLTDHHRHNEAFHPTAGIARQCGRMVALMHQAQQANPVFQAADFLQQEQLHASTEAKRARAIAEAFEPKAAVNETTRWVANLLSPLLERLERSAQLLVSPHIDPDQLAVSHRFLYRDNWGMVNDKLFLRGFFRPVLSVQHRDVACYLKEQFLRDEDWQQVEAFLDGYEEVKPLTYGEYTLLLAFMAYPGDVWRNAEAFVTTVRQQGEASITDIKQALANQETVDRLLRQIAHRAEQARSGTAYEPI
jgi:Ser/Thr protein kinase RdoA (MazF antagonist)